MPILSKNGDKKNRASAIIAEMNKNKQGDKPPQDTPPVDTPPVDVPPVDTPPVDTPPVDNNTPPVDTPPVDVPPADEPPVETPPLAEVTDEVILSKLSETLGRKIESYDDLKPKEIAVDPELKQLLEWKEKTGLSLTQWADYNKDYSEMSDIDVTREILSTKYPDFDQAEINYLLKDFVYDEDYDDDDEKMQKNIKLKQFATDGRRELEAKKLELKPLESAGLTQEQQEAIQFAEQVRQAQATAEVSQEAYNKNLNQAALNLDTIPLNLAEGVELSHKVDDSSKNGLSDFISNIPHWFNQDGTPNHEAIAVDGYKIQNFDKLLNLAFEQGKAVQKEADIKGKGNITLDAQGKPQDNGSERKGNIHQVVDKLVGGNPNKFRFRRRN